MSQTNLTTKYIPSCKELILFFSWCTNLLSDLATAPFLCLIGTEIFSWLKFAANFCAYSCRNLSCPWLMVCVFLPNMQIFPAEGYLGIAQQAGHQPGTNLSALDQARRPHGHRAPRPMPPIPGLNRTELRLPCQPLQTQCC